MKNLFWISLAAVTFSQPALSLEREWKMVVKHFDSITNQSFELVTDVTYDSGRKCHRDAYIMNVNSNDGSFSNLTTSDLVRYFCIALPKPDESS
ncbi:hypothetical protein AB8880_02710 [Alphaproteobacteria bacterium LSUCC0684]